MPSVKCGGYTPQDIPCQTWQGSTGSSVGVGAHSRTPNPQDTSTQSSEIYSAVAVHVPTEENSEQATTETRETRNLPLPSSEEPWDRGGVSRKLMLHGVPPLPDLDACESNPAGSLLLHTLRDTNGQLVLPLLTVQLKSSTGDTESPLNPERKLLLSDLIESNNEGPSLASLQSFDNSAWSDSGCDDSTVNSPTQPYCNTHFSPSQLLVPDFHQQSDQNRPSGDVLFESGYKQNWMPASLLGDASKDSCDYRRTNYPSTWTGPRKA